MFYCGSVALNRSCSSDDEGDDVRLLNKLYAFAMGYFWLPCPACNKYFGGHEWTNTDGGLPSDNGMREGICNTCAAERLKLHNHGRCDNTCGRCYREAGINQLLNSAGVKIAIRPN